MTIATTSVGDLAIRIPGATNVLERFHIDYCCGGRTSLGEACAAAGVSIEAVEKEIARSSTVAVDQAFSERQSVSALLDQIRRHHAYTREALERLGALAAKVAGVHGERHPWLSGLRHLVAELDEDLRPHMMKEERVLFPYIEDLADAALSGRSATPPFGTVQNPIRMMMRDHEQCGEILRAIRTVTSDYSLPSDACASFAALYTALQELEKDLHQHIHLENNLLFPKAIALESKK